MNIVILDGRLSTLPKISYLQIADRSIGACKFVIAVKAQKMQYGTLDEESGCVKEDIDFFECAAFDEAARLLNRNFHKGEKVIVRGQMKNFTFSDANRTPHFTNIVIVEQIESGDSNSMDLSITADLKETDIIFKEICRAGFLCVDEDDYYRIAVSAM